MKLYSVLLLLVTAFSSVVQAKEVVIIDTDTTAFRPLTLDMEDDLAVLFSMSSPEIDVKGLTITFGNGFQFQTYRDAQKLKRLAGWDIPVLRGADYFKKDLNRPTEASDFIVETARNTPEGITILALGAMTNIATAIQSAPDIVAKINRIIMMGGNISKTNLDVNFAADDKASNLLFNAPIKKIILPTETCLQTVFTDGQLEQIEAEPDTVIYQIRGRIKSYLAIWKLVHDFFYPIEDYPYKVNGGFIPWDSVSAAYMVKPEIFSNESCYSVQMVDGVFQAALCDDVSDFRGKAIVPLNVDRVAFDEIFMERLLFTKVVER